MSNNNSAVVVWGNQLNISHHTALRAHPNAPVILIESRSMCRKYPYHKIKLVFMLTAMRDYADELRAAGREVIYATVDEAEDRWFDELARICDKQKFEQLTVMRQNDRSAQLNLEKWCEKRNIKLETTPNELFLTPQSEFADWADGRKVLQLETFYRYQRKRLNILMNGSKPEGDKWNFDHDNREPLPKDYTAPTIKPAARSKHYADVVKLVETEFADHPGSLDRFWLPTSRADAEIWLDEFINNRFNEFGRYEDAMRAGEVFINHSAISTLLNVGLLHSAYVVKRALEANAPLASREGFVRQIIGWREFMFSLYHYKPYKWRTSNFLRHTKKLESYWWKLLPESGEPPVDDVLSRVATHAYSHHIERLMVLGNYMLLNQYSPHEVYKWFMSMYADAFEWVMVPNIYGMSQYADGGMDGGGFATKPYISGSNYLQKMGSWWPSAAAAKQSKWTTLYWQFLSDHNEELKNNHRLAPLMRNARARAKQG